MNKPFNRIFLSTCDVQPTDSTDCQLWTASPAPLPLLVAMASVDIRMYPIMLWKSKLSDVSMLQGDEEEARHLNSVRVWACLGFSYSTVMCSCIDPQSVCLSPQIKGLSVHEESCIMSASSWLLIARPLSPFLRLPFSFVHFAPSVSHTVIVFLVFSSFLRSVWLDESWQTPVNPLSGLAH